MPYQLIFPDYIDTSTHKTLVVTPGNTYSVAVASGRIAATPALPNDGRLIVASGIINLEEEVLPQPGKPPEVEKPAVTVSQTASNKEGA
jgi:hypothetical protein